jgi:hypothetical protein
VFAPPVCWDLELVEHFDEAARQVPPQAMHDVVRISADPAQHAAWLHEYAELGFDEIYLHHVGQRQQEFIDVFGGKVLPQLASEGGAASRRASGVVDRRPRSVDRGRPRSEREGERDHEDGGRS